MPLFYYSTEISLWLLLYNILPSSFLFSPWSYFKVHIKIVISYVCSTFEVIAFYEFSKMLKYKMNEKIITIFYLRMLKVIKQRCCFVQVHFLSSNTKKYLDAMIENIHVRFYGILSFMSFKNLKTSKSLQIYNFFIKQ